MGNKIPPPCFKKKKTRDPKQKQKQKIGKEVGWEENGRIEREVSGRLVDVCCYSRFPNHPKMSPSFSVFFCRHLGFKSLSVRPSKMYIAHTQFSSLWVPKRLYRHSHTKHIHLFKSLTHTPSWYGFKKKGKKWTKIRNSTDQQNIKEWKKTPR